ncbi:metallophosphoesterase family protein [Levilactobacillus spicheri]|uniref:Calcineurin-like phosphoesterase domain-containing protein n=1 Tax=Levilactobacillus spicheri TaxID=216463 RepID=A0A0F3RX86_9LACO|nr:metallophosphoesterase family protein [Levilactobacillus spicheri]KJW13392.1 hypothetical protein VC81_02700 [Levilactobacillus spicheri]
MAKIAMISDVHGNVTALQAAIADAQAAGCTDYWFLGDLFFPGPGAHDLLALLDELPVKLFVRGNWEDILLATLDGQIDATDPMDIYATILGDYIQAHLTAADIQRIRDLPMVQTATVDGLTFQLSHNQLTKNFGHALMPAEAQAAFDALAGETADVVLYGHTHHQLLRQSTAGQLIMNPGTVGMPFAHWDRFATDLRAQYAIVTTHGLNAPAVDFRRVSYDAAAELALATNRHLPYLELYTEQLQTGRVHTHDRATLAATTKQLGYQVRFAAIWDRIKPQD